MSRLFETEAMTASASKIATALMLSSLVSAYSSQMEQHRASEKALDLMMVPVQFSTQMKNKQAGYSLIKRADSVSFNEYVIIWEDGSLVFR